MMSRSTELSSLILSARKFITSSTRVLLSTSADIALAGLDFRLHGLLALASAKGLFSISDFVIEVHSPLRTCRPAW